MLLLLAALLPILLEVGLPCAGHSGSASGRAVCVEVGIVHRLSVAAELELLHHLHLLLDELLLLRTLHDGRRVRRDLFLDWDR